MKREKERQDVEYKSSWHDEYLKWICGFANAQGAVMFLGVDDNREICGLKNTKKLMEDIPNKIVNTMGLVVDVNLWEKDGMEYIELKIPTSNIPISYKGKYYYRSGSTMQELNGAALQQFILKKMGRSWDDITNEHATLADIDRKAVDYMLRKGIEADRIPNELRNATTKKVLTSLHLFDERGYLKNAALLLFAKDPLKFFTSVRFKIGRFGMNEGDILIHDVIEGNIIQMADRVVDVLKAKYLASLIRFKGMQRIEELEVPIEALRELLYNSIVHKDYTGPDIQMRVYSDRVELWNAGVLPEGYDENVLYGEHSSMPRNRNIADTMFKAGFIDTWGRGYSKIREGFKNIGMPMPSVRVHCGGTLVVFQRGYDVVKGRKNVTSDVAVNVTSLSPVKITERQKKIRKMLVKNPRISVKEMSLVLSLAERTIKRDLAVLQKMGLIIREGNTSAGRWVIIGDC